MPQPYRPGFGFAFKPPPGVSPCAWSLPRASASSTSRPTGGSSPPSSVRPLKDSRAKWITYGSSITHCAGANSPARAWPAWVARKHDLNLTCLGFGGNCHMEPMLARLIRDMPADFVSLKVGINIYTAGSLSARSFQSALIGFVQIIRENHPHIPLAVISPITSPSREKRPGKGGLSLEMMRDHLREAVGRLRLRGPAGLLL